MAYNQTLKDQLVAKNTQVQVIVQQINNINLAIHRLTEKFNVESNKLQHRIDKVQFSRPRGNPSNYWPHSPMTDRIRAFYVIKERKESDLRRVKDSKRQTFDHEKAILTSRLLPLTKDKHELESQIKKINIQLNNPINYSFWSMCGN